MTNLEFYKEEIKELLSDCYLESALNKVYEGHAHSTIGAYDVLDWLCEEHKDPVLNKEEKEYLSDVIRPFRKKVECIVKRDTQDQQYEYISIFYEDIHNSEGIIYLPCFEAGMVYKDMELDKPYTLEELEL